MPSWPSAIRKNGRRGTVKWTIIFEGARTQLSAQLGRRNCSGPVAAAWGACGRGGAASVLHSGRRARGVEVSGRAPGGQRLAHVTNGSVTKGQGEDLGTEGTEGSVLTSEEEAGLGVGLEVVRGDGFQKGEGLALLPRSCSSHPLLWTSLSFQCCLVCLPNMPLIHPRLCVSSATAVTTASPLHVATTDPHLLSCVLPRLSSQIQRGRGRVLTC